MNTTAIHVQGGPVVIPPQHQPQQPHNLGTIKNLAVTQLVIGVLTVIFGISVIAALYTNAWTTNTAAGLWAGGWIAITGIIGVCSTRSPTNNLNGVYMAFSIISTCASALAGLFFILAVVYYAIRTSCYSTTIFGRRINYDCDYRNVGLGLHVPLLILMIVEFFISIIAAVYACQRGCAGGGGQGGVIIQPAQPHVSVITAGQGAGGYQYTMAPVQYGQPGQQYGQPGQQYGQPGQQYGQPAQQYNGQMYPQQSQQVPPAYGGQTVYVQSQAYPMQSNVVYSEKPPEYNAVVN